MDVLGDIVEWLLEKISKRRDDVDGQVERAEYGPHLPLPEVEYVERPPEPIENEPR